MDFIADLKDVQFAIFLQLKIFLGGDVKRLVCVPPLPANLGELKQRICCTADFYPRHAAACLGWEELEYRIDVCRVSGGAHIEHL